MKKIILLIFCVLLVGAFAFTHLSCTSDDDDETTDTTPSARQATLNQQNVDDAINYVEESLPFCSMDTSTQQATAIRATLDLVEDIADQIVLSRSAQGERTAQAEAMLPIQGNCPGQEGTATLYMNQDEATGNFTGTLTGDSYCQQVTDGEETSQITINGLINFSGNMDPSATEISLASLTSLNVSTDGSVTVDVDGETLILLSMQNASVIVSGSTYDASMDSMSISQQSGGIVLHSFQINNLSAQVIGGDGQTTLTTGIAEFVDSIEGAVTISVSNLIVTDTGVVTSGIVTVNGADGTSLQITPQDINRFLIQVDTDGDGTFDYEPGCLDCSGLDVSSLGS